MKRRDLLKAASAAGAVLATAKDWTAAAQPPSELVSDVLVVGGGTAGVVAAIQAARAGARIVLLEMGSQLGGTITAGGVAAPGLFHAWGRQIIGGIGWELVLKTVELHGGRLPDFTTVPKHHYHHQISINASLYAALAEEACLEAGVTVGYYETPLSVSEQKDGWIVETVGKGLCRRISCRQLIDCTGGADIVGLIGLARLRDTETQPGTLMFTLGNYDVSKLDPELIQNRYREALAAGDLQDGDYQHRNAPFINFLRCGGRNAQHVFGADSSTAINKTRANIAGRASMLRLLRFVRTLPGCQQAQLLEMAPETGVRETYRIVGEVQITVEDYTSGRVFEDAVAYSFYPIDLHDGRGVKPEPLRPGVVPTIPLRALVPKGSRNLLVAGRSISSDRLANSALRVQASCMAMGQAAGAAAAMAAARGETPLAVPYSMLKELLGKHGAIIPS